MTLHDYIKSHIEIVRPDCGMDDLWPIYEAIGPDAWPDDRATAREVATALLNGDDEALGLAMRDHFFQYMRELAEQSSLEVDDVSK